MKHDYWIGDRVMIASLQRPGIFEGERDGLALIKIDGNRKPFDFSDISLLPDEEEDLETIEANDREGISKSAESPDEIDLHIEELNLSLVNAEPAMILAHQRSRLHDFLRAAIAHRAKEVHVIHGKGEGVLKSETLSIIAQYDAVDSIEHVSQGGAVIVRLKR